MLESVKDMLTKDIELERVKGFLEMEIEIKRLKELLATEIKLKQFLLQEVDVKSLIPSVKNTDKKGKILGSVEGNENGNAVPKLIKDVLEDYDEGLIATLRNDHKELLFIYNEIIKNAEAKKFSLVRIHLGTFQGLLTQHYHKADEQLYTYLDAFISYKYPKRKAAFQLLNQEMKKISISIFYSLGESVEISLSEDTFYCFMCVFTRLGRQLNKRIHSEATLLLTMYEESESINSYRRL